MRPFSSPVRVLTIAVLGLLALAGRNAPGRDKPGDRLQADTVWRGTLLYDKSDYNLDPKPDAMILYVKKRKGANFQGFTWYPNQSNGVLKVKGKVGREGKVIFTEEKVIHGKAGFPDNLEGVNAPNEFVGKLDETTMKGTGKWKGPAPNGEIRMKFTLKRAE